MCFSASTLRAQNNIFTQGTSNLNVGLFVPTYFPRAMHPPVSISYDCGVADFGQNVGSLGVGAYLGFAISKMYYIDIFNSRYVLGRETFFCVGPRVSYHFSGIPNVPKLDLYGVLFLGVQMINSPFSHYNKGQLTEPGLSLAFAADAKVGAKYWFTKSFCFYLEAGWGHISMLEGGVSFKF